MSIKICSVLFYTVGWLSKNISAKWKSTLLQRQPEQSFCPFICLFLDDYLDLSITFNPTYPSCLYF